MRKTLQELLAEDATGTKTFFRNRRRVRMPFDSCPTPFYPVRTLDDMTSAKMDALEAKYGCKIARRQERFGR
jgi:hypothetical protein